jgi:hypothetical protein
VTGHRDGPARVALALAVGVSVFVILLGAATFFAIASKQNTLSAEAVSVVSAVVGGIVGALAVYLGGGESPRRPPPDRNDAGDAGGTEGDT